MVFSYDKKERKQRQEEEAVVVLSCRHLGQITDAVAAVRSDWSADQGAGRTDWSDEQAVDRPGWSADEVVCDGGISAVHVGASFTILLPVALGKTEIIIISYRYIIILRFTDLAMQG